MNSEYLILVSVYRRARVRGPPDVFVAVGQSNQPPISFCERLQKKSASLPPKGLVILLPPSPSVSRIAFFSK